MRKLRLVIIICLLTCCSALLLACGGPTLDGPANLRVNANTLVLTWNKVPDARGYVIDFGDSQKTVNVNSYSLEGLQPGDYGIRVKALDRKSVV